jgi:uncharacterized iron-regulated protein
MRMPIHLLLLVLALAMPWQAAVATASTPAHPGKAIRIDATPADLAAAMATRRNVLLGEVHDNGVQHALRLAALKLRIAAGERPALAFEQFDRQQQPDIERLRRERPGDVEALVALGAKNWEWRFYRPFVQLALEHGLPIVAANLSRPEALQVSMIGWSAVFDEATQAALGLDRLAPDFVAAHERAVAQGHCDLLPAAALPAIARAQIARDIVLAQSLRPHLERGVVLLTGNGHARTDIGVPFWLADARAALVSIALVEDEGSADDLPFDFALVTAAAERPDPCESLRRRLAPK